MFARTENKALLFYIMIIFFYRFQDELEKSLNEELFQQQLAQERKSNGRYTQDHFEWTFAKAFLYSLTVLTTIGKYYKLETTTYYTHTQTHPPAMPLTCESALTTQNRTLKLDNRFEPR